MQSLKRFYFGKKKQSQTIDIDTDAANYIASAGLQTHQTPINNLFISLKEEGLYTKIKAMYPFLGTSASQHKWNAKDPRDVDAAFRLVFYGSGTHTDLGYQCNGTDAYADTWFAPRTHLSTNYCGTTLVCLTNNTNTTTGATYDIGCYTSLTDFMRMSTRSSNSGFTMRANISNHSISVPGTSESGKGIFTQSKTSTSSLKLYKNGSVLGQSTTSATGTLPTRNIYIGTSNGNTTYSSQRLGFVAIHEGLTDEEATSLHNIIDTFESAIGRKTW